ncbi:cytochrome ubiquinol oxidase subunit I [Rhodococcus sp. X156]|uniref:cytochrome ubiquinol oxidase subunit I n=1 Tax=Rhodococcus sp. X156 TaxID=2499145 RepID=UPI000FD72E3B|nr:cytochrome ubiquinol oxidase subunit I [Rhodococcus sp. X156]
MDVLDIARWQFGITTVYHFIMVPLTLGLGILVVAMNTLWVRTGSATWLRMTRFWGRIYLINFALGVATGLVQEFQFGLAWSEYSKFVGDMFGSLLALEALVAFFLESVFLGVWIFGWGRIPKKVHLASIWLAVGGSIASAYFILGANSWMQHPVGVTRDADGTPVLNDVWAVLTNNTLLAAFSHVISGALAVAGALLVGVAWYHLNRRRKEELPTNDLEHGVWMKSLRLGGWVSVVAFVLVTLTGDWQGKLMYQQQPMKMSSAEALCNTEQPAAFSVFAVGKANSNQCDDVHSVTIPGVLSLLAHGNFSDPVPGVNQLKQEYQAAYGTSYPDDPAVLGERAGQPIDYQPLLAVTYWGFRLMIGLGFVSAIVSALALWVTRKGRLPDNRLVSSGGTWLAVATIFAPFVANSAGWVFTEMGRQPFVVAPNPDVPLDQRVWFFTAQAVSPGVGGAEVLTSLISLTLLYGALAVVELWLVVKFVRKGVPTDAGGTSSSEPPSSDGGGPQGPDRPQDPDGRRRDDAREEDGVLSFAY